MERGVALFEGRTLIFWETTKQWWHWEVYPKSRWTYSVHREIRTTKISRKFSRIFQYETNIYKISEHVKTKLWRCSCPIMLDEYFLKWFYCPLALTKQYHKVVIRYIHLVILFMRWHMSLPLSAWKYFHIYLYFEWSLPLIRWCRFICTLLASC